MPVTRTHAWILVSGATLKSLDSPVSSYFSMPRPVLTSALGASCAASSAGMESRMRARRMDPPGLDGRLCPGDASGPNGQSLDHVPDTGAETGVGDPVQPFRKT